MKKSLFVILLAAAVLFGIIDCSGNGTDPQGTFSVFVESEFAPLKKVIVSRSEATDAILPLSKSYIPLDEALASGAELMGDSLIFSADHELLEKMEE